MNLPLDLIEPGQRLREVSPERVAELVASIADVGLLSPITVYARKLYRGGVQVDGFGLIAGAHRLEAFRAMGRVEIPATVLVLDDLERQIAECDENLQGPRLTPTERARFVKRRKEAYEALHPETRHGANLERSGVAKFATPEAERFTANTAKATGQSERTIQLAAERGAKIPPEILDMIAGTKLDTGAYMDRIKNLVGSQQFRAVERDLAFERSREREAKKKAAAKTPAGKAKMAAKRAAERIMHEWRRAGAEGQAIFKKEAGLVGVGTSTAKES